MYTIRKHSDTPFGEQFDGYEYLAPDNKVLAKIYTKRRKYDYSIYLIWH